MPNKPATQHRSVRVPDELWETALRVAADNGETVAAVIRRDLARYVRDFGRESDAGVILSLLEYVAAHGDDEEREVVRALIERRAG